MDDRDRKLLARLTDKSAAPGGSDEGITETLKEFGIGFLEGLFGFLQGLMPGAQMRRNLNRADKRNPEPDQVRIDFTPEKVFQGIPLKDSEKDAPPKLSGPTPQKSKQLTSDAGKARQSKGMLPHHRRT
jgi:hypothetical protein